MMHCFAAVVFSRRARPTPLIRVTGGVVSAIFSGLPLFSQRAREGTSIGSAVELGIQFLVAVCSPGSCCCCALCWPVPQVTGGRGGGETEGWNTHLSDASLVRQTFSATLMMLMMCKVSTVGLKCSMAEGLGFLITRIVLCAKVCRMY